ncbi:MAG: glutamine synthetase [Alphaproteobacteria bacterium]|nr:glutamine synthetase [Alphaproteobacteria bacterium]
MSLSLDDLTAQIESGEIDTVVVADTDMQGRLYGKRLSGRHFLEVGKDGVGTCSVVLGWGQDHALDPGYRFTGWDTGYPDMISVPILSTLRSCGWHPRTALVLADARSLEGEAVDVSPRVMLRRQLDRCEALGLHPKCASELEFFLLRESPDSLHEKGFVNIRPRHHAMHPETVMRTSEDEDFAQTLRGALAQSDVLVELVKAEYSPGQMEVNLRYDDALAAADAHMLLKTAAKEIALQQGLVATFMAKVSHDLGGSSCHVHMSMLDGSGASAFDDGDGSMSETMRSFVAGILKYGRDFFLLFAPTTNSYKRLIPNTFAPARLGWAIDNRTVALRVIGRGTAKRIENRIPGADVNPYLAYAAMLAAGISGIEQKLALEDAPQDGNAYAQDSGAPIPADLVEATAAFADSEVVAAAFTADVQAHYANFGRQTAGAFDTKVTDVERRLLLLDI